MNPKALTPLLVATALVAASCTPALKLTPSDADVVLSRQVLDAPDPGRAGRHRVLTLRIGSSKGLSGREAR